MVVKLAQSKVERLNGFLVQSGQYRDEIAFSAGIFKALQRCRDQHAAHRAHTGTVRMWLNRSLLLIGFALLFSFVVPLFGYFYLGPLYAALFLTGYLGGFVLWLLIPTRAQWTSLRVPYWLTMLAFLLLHKVEENRMAFFEVVSDRITGTPVPEVSMGLFLALLIIPIGAWLAVPIFIARDHEFGRFLAWTFFASMGITELAHFVLPLLTDDAYGYFPGMASVVVLAPLAWWGM